MPFFRGTRYAILGGQSVSAGTGGIGGGPALWDFDSLTSARFWWEAPQTGSDDDPITQITDISGNGNHATQATSARRAILDTVGTLNGYNVAEFQSANQHWYAFADVFSAFTEGMCIYVCKMKADPAGNQADAGGWFRTGTSGQQSFLPFTDASVYDDFGSAARPNRGNPSSSLTSWRIISHHSKSASWDMYIDGIALYSGGANTVSFNTVPWIGKGTEGHFVNGYWAQAVIANSWLGGASDSDRQKAEGRLAHKFGLTGNLDAGHPYKTTPPTV